MAPLVTALAVHDRTGMLRSGAHGTAGAWGLPDLLGMLCPAVVADLELEVHPSPAIDALQALPRLAAGLTALNLDAQRLPPEAAAVLPQLPSLRSLRLAAQHLPEGALPAILQLPLLSRLELESSFLPLPPMAPLTALRRLKQLRLVDDSERQDALPLPAPADFTAQGGLDSLTVFTRQTWQVGPGEDLACQLMITTVRRQRTGWPGMCTPPRKLCSWSPAAHRSSLHVQVADTRAGFLFLHRSAAPLCGRLAHTSPGEAACSASLTLHGHSRRDARLSSLAALLAALLPTGNSAAPAPLRFLHIGGFLQLPAEEVEVCPGLAAVQHLGLARCGANGGPLGSSLEDAEAALAALLAQMPALQELDLSGWPGSSLPGCAASSAAGLTQLVLAESGLTGLPSSACPAGVHRLSWLRWQAAVVDALPLCTSADACLLHTCALPSCCCASAAHLVACRPSALPPCPSRSPGAGLAPLPQPSLHRR